uniref:putative receptor protein kinase ZmPK1 n=1 Tax=Erigeron canadensis TaxID=72917 RepID=UPI001CB8EC08|nr:putative receptor protein kinase ZmPK1 [Erigeron canadensis]
MFFLISPIHSLTRGSSLSVENNEDILTSPNNLFTAGFHKVGENAYCFAIWFTDQPTTDDVRTVVWMANRDEPVNGKSSKLSLSKDGNLVLTDADQYIIWSTQTKSNSASFQLQLHNTGNLVLQEKQQILWQSFDFPTDTLLPNQHLSKSTQLVSSRSSTNFSSGFYKLFFDTDSILRLHYDSQETTTVYWPDPGMLPWESGRYQYLYKRKASLDSYGRFNSSDGLNFESADFGILVQRMMKIDIDGNLRVYSLVENQLGRQKWEVQWQAIPHSCRIHGICGQNSLCTYAYSQDLSRSCSCLHGYKMVNSQDWSYGCEPISKTCKPENEDFIELRHVEFYGYDIRYHENYTLDACKQDCLQDCACKGFQLGYDDEEFVNKKSSFSCEVPKVSTVLTRTYEKKRDSKPLRFMLVLGCVIGFLEIISILYFWVKSRKRAVTPDETYFLAMTSFRKFTYKELKTASRNFSEEIGRGGASVVYKGRLSDNRIVAIKKLKNSSHQGEAEFQAELSIIGRLNHMNLLETWGYCAEGKHRLVVYEYMENGSLAENLSSGKLDWEKRMDIAIGTAKGLAYLHEECLEWVLHCDVKPHNVLLDDNYNPKVADFGLSKLLDRGGMGTSKFSTARGTRGYMAPEWVFHLPITSKVDVYSYGVVILEMITGRGPGRKQQTSEEGDISERGVVEWVRGMIQEFDGNSRDGSCVEKIVNGSVSGEFDRKTMENLVRIALQCVEEDMDVRPTMSQVVHMLLHPAENDS